MAMKKSALAVVESFKIADRYEGIAPELLAELNDEMEDLDPENGISCRQIKVPSGGGIAYEVQGEEDDPALTLSIHAESPSGLLPSPG